MLRHQHHTMQNQLRDHNRMAGPIRPMQQANMPPLHQPQHILPHRSPHQPILSIPPHQQHMHHMQHPGPPHGNPRQPMLMGMNTHNTNNTMVGVGMKDQANTVSVTLQNSSVQQAQYQHQQQSQQQQPNNQQNQSSQQQSLPQAQQQQVPQAQQQQQHVTQQSSMEQAKSTDGESVDDNLSTQGHASTSSSLANMKEKTPMCLLNELARFNRIQHQYRLTNEQGPAHKKKFTVTLKLGEEEYVADGPSIKKAQHSAATEALANTWYRQPPPKPTKAMRIGHLGKCPTGAGHLPPTVELNALAMKRGEPTIYTFRQAPPAALQHQFMPHAFGGNFQRGYTPRLTYNRGVHPDHQGMYLVSLKVGEREFTGRGLTGQAARHDAASRALEQLRQLPLPEEMSSVTSANENGTLTGIDDPNAELKSPVSLVHETALKRGLPVTFEVVSETGKPHIRTFTTKCTVGDKFTVGEGSSKKVSKKRAAESMLDQLKLLPPLPAIIQNRSTRVKRKPPATKKKSRNLIKVYQEPRSENEAAEEVNPVSRLVQIQQAKKEKEPVYNLIDEKGAPRRREFVMEVTMGQHSAQGIGPNKKLAKRAAAEALLTQLGYSKPSPQPAKPSIKTGESENTESKPRKVTFLEDEQVNDTQPHSVGGTIGRQLVPGLLLVDGGQESKLGNGPSVQIVAEELRGQQQNSAGVSPSDQLTYLAQLFNFSVEFNDFPKGVSINKEYLSLVSIGTDPPQVCHGNGETIIASRNQAALRALRTLSKLGLDNASNGTQVKKDKGASGDGIHINMQVKNNMMDGAIDK
ncbi:double-stranded RNA-binding protein Staufen homolog 2 isoform X2 [Ooceraea biroi]|uniref:Double-stranded RNA-binding protein Staufen-like protein n=1 Tax=Ooceraea biroi TaxID=2015173 RepID=A0A026VVA6_OOCBI|nr:double-stranded RNA-binding protein Staufen homolog 2 isoform X2 [Ooceraea biroi]EZA47672.1 Double-stranded RNA-binding protein Staufen-like protein [Ooceraea biroi]